MRFIVVTCVCVNLSKQQTMINVEKIRFVHRYEDEDDIGAKSVIYFDGDRYDAALYVADDFEALRSRLSDLELPMPGVAQ